MSFRLQLGNLGEWAAAAGTTAAVIISAWTIRLDHREKREREAAKVDASVSIGNMYTDASGERRNLMRIVVTNNGDHQIRDVQAVLYSVRHEELACWSWGAIEPHYFEQAELSPELEEWQRGMGMPSPLNMLKVIFVDVDGKKWLRSSEGKTVQIRGKRSGC